MDQRNTSMCNPSSVCYTVPFTVTCKSLHELPFLVSASITPLLLIMTSLLLLECAKFNPSSSLYKYCASDENALPVHLRWTPSQESCLHSNTSTSDSESPSLTSPGVVLPYIDSLLWILLYSNSISFLYRNYIWNYSTYVFIHLFIFLH